MKLKLILMWSINLFLLILLDYGDLTAKPITKDQTEQGTKRERVATLELMNTAEVTEKELSYLNDLVYQAMGRLPLSRYEVIMKEHMMMLSQGKQLESCDTACAVQRAHEIGVHWVVTGEVMRFEGEVRVRLSLYQSKLGELREEGTVKAREMKELKGPLQAEAVGLFAAIDPSLKRLVERLKQGIMFEKMTLGVLPEVPKLDEEGKVRSIEMPSPILVSVIDEVDFNNIDIKGLYLYDKALKADKNSSIKPKLKIKLWQAMLMHGLSKDNVHIMKEKNEGESHLKHGFVFEQVTYQPLPELSQIKGELDTIEMPSPIQESMVKGIDFKTVDIRGLKLYERALKADQDDSVDVKVKLSLWKAVLQAKMSELKALAQERMDIWESVIKKRARRDAEYEQRMQQELDKFEEIISKEYHQEIDQSERMRLDWERLSQLLSFEVVSEKDKLSWFKVFIELYDTTFLFDEMFKRYALKIKDPLVNLHHKRLAEKRQHRSYEIKDHRDEIAEELNWLSDSRLANEHARKIGIEFVVIPSGVFRMRNALDEQISVHVPEFLVSKTEVTVAQYRYCVQEGPCEKPKTGGECNWGKSGREDHPINCVDWAQARTFANWLYADLPTKAEWIYMAQIGEDFEHTRSHIFDEEAWHASNSRGSTHSVGLKKSNGFGLYDIIGNVWEWTVDEDAESYLLHESKDLIDGSLANADVPSCESGKCDYGSTNTQRVYCGGSWDYSFGIIDISHCNALPPNHYGYDLGFRIAKILEPF